MKAFFTILILLTSINLRAEEESASDKSFVLCKNKKEVRSIRLETKGSSCRVYYSKAGQEDVVAKSTSQDKCREVASQIRSTIEKVNWQCKDFGVDRVSFSAE